MRNWTSIVSQDGWTALIGASYEGHLEFVNALLAAGAETEAKEAVRGWMLIFYG